MPLKSRRDKFEEQLRALQTDINHLSHKLSVPASYSTNSYSPSSVPLDSQKVQSKSSVKYEKSIPSASGNNSSIIGLSNPTQMGEFVNYSRHSSSDFSHLIADRSEQPDLTNGLKQRPLRDDYELSQYNEREKQKESKESKESSRVQDESDTYTLIRERDKLLDRLELAQSQIEELRRVVLEGRDIQTQYDRLAQDHELINISLESSERIRRQQKELIHLLQRTAAVAESTQDLGLGASLSPSTVSTAAENRNWLNAFSGNNSILSRDMNYTNNSLRMSDSGRLLENSINEGANGFNMSHNNYSNYDSAIDISGRERNTPSNERKMKLTGSNGTAKIRKVTRASTGTGSGSNSSAKPSTRMSSRNNATHTTHSTHSTHNANGTNGINNTNGKYMPHTNGVNGGSNGHSAVKSSQKSEKQFDNRHNSIMKGTDKTGNGEMGERGIADRGDRGQHHSQLSYFDNHVASSLSSLGVESNRGYDMTSQLSVSDSMIPAHHTNRPRSGTNPGTSQGLSVGVSPQQHQQHQQQSQQISRLRSHSSAPSSPKSKEMRELRLFHNENGGGNGGNGRAVSADGKGRSHGIAGSNISYNGSGSSRGGVRSSSSTGTRPSSANKTSRERGREARERGRESGIAELINYTLQPIPVPPKRVSGRPPIPHPTRDPGPASYLTLKAQGTRGSSFSTAQHLSSSPSYYAKM